MIKVVAKNIVKADQVAEFIALGKKLVEETNRNDKGCISYELYQDMDHPEILTMIEEWESQQALEQHMAAKHFQEIIPQ
jgi:quinol monooxygenase YgiN